MMIILARHAVERGDQEAASVELHRALAMMDALAGEEKVARFNELRKKLEKQLDARA